MINAPRRDDWNLSSKPKPTTPCLSLRLREAAAALGVSDRTLWEWTQRGDVPHIRRGGVVLFPVDGLRRWLDEQAKAAATPAANKIEGGAE